MPAEKKETIIDLFVQQGDDRRSARKGALGEDRKLRPLFPARRYPKARKQRRAYAKELLAAFAQKAYRRPLSPQDGDDTAERLATLAEATYYREPGKTFEQGVAHAMAAVLASPRFLFRLEAPAAHALNAQVADVDEYSLASRLSYFLWSTMPDDELHEPGGARRTAQATAAQVKRMLADPRAENLARNFTGQWLQARDVEGIASNPREIIMRDAGEEGSLRELRQAWRNQDEATAKRAGGIHRQASWMRSPSSTTTCARRCAAKRKCSSAIVIARRPPVTELIDSNYTFVNEQLATLYGLPGVTGPEMRKVTLPAGSPRGGVLTQGSALLVTSNPDRTSPVKRGLFVLANFLGTPPPPPPANVPALEASESDFKGHDPVLRDILKVHRENPAVRVLPQPHGPDRPRFRELQRAGHVARYGAQATHRSFTATSSPANPSTAWRSSSVFSSRSHRQEFYHTLTRKLLTYAVRARHGVLRRGDHRPRS